MAETPDRCNPDSNCACPGFTKCSPAPVSTAIISTGSVETFERSAIKSAAAVTGLVCVGYLQYLQFDVVDAVAQEQLLHGSGHLSSTTQCGPIQRAPSGVVVDGFLLQSLHLHITSSSMEMGRLLLSMLHLRL